MGGSAGGSQRGRETRRIERPCCRNADLLTSLAVPLKFGANFAGAAVARLQL